MLSFSNVEIKQSKNGEFKTATVKDETGSFRAGIWRNSYQLYDSVIDGASLNGKIVQKGNYSNVVDSVPVRKAGVFVGVQAAQEAKRQNILEAQLNREEGIKIASTLNKAVEIAIARLGSAAREKYEEEISFWRLHLWREWEKHSDFPPF